MNLEFKSINIKSFMSIGEVNLDLTDRGLTLVEGQNQFEPLLNSNGSGKSALFESILWVLTGSTSRGLKHVSNKYTEQGAQVELDLTINGVEYTITRSEKPSKSLSILQGEVDLSGATYTKSNSVLSDLLNGIDYDQLTSIILLSQGLPGRFTSLSPSARKSRLESISGITENLQSLSTSIDYKYNQINSELTSTRSILSKLEGSISSLEQSNSRIESKLKKPLIEASEYNKITEESSTLESEISELQSTKDTISQKVSELSKDKSQLTMSKSQITQQVSRIKSELASFSKSVCPTCGATREFTNEINQRTEELQTLIPQEADFNVKLESIEEILPELTSELQSITQELTNKSRRLSEITQISKEYEAQESERSNYQAVIDENNSEIAKLSEDRSALTEKVSELSNQLAIASYYKSNLSKKFRTYLMESVVESMNSKLSEISKFLYQVQGEVTLQCNGNNIDIYLGDREVESLSGGELRRVDLIIQLAQRELTEQYSGFSCNLLVLDEVLDYLDASGVSNVISMIEAKSMDVNTLMVVSHRSDIDLSCDTKLTVVKGSNQISQLLQ